MELFSVKVSQTSTWEKWTVKTVRNHVSKKEKLQRANNGTDALLVASIN